MRKPYLDKLHQPLAVNRGTLDKRGTFDQLIVDALIERQDAQIAFSTGFRWGTSILPGETITTEHLMVQTATTYPMVTQNQMTDKQVMKYWKISLTIALTHTINWGGVIWCVWVALVIT